MTSLYVIEAGMREGEAQQYRDNIERFGFMLKSLPAETWPEELAHYSNPAVVVPTELDDAIEDTIATLRRRDMLINRVRSERAQLAIVEATIDFLKAKIGKGYDKLVAAERANPTNA